MGGLIDMWFELFRALSRLGRLGGLLLLATCAGVGYGSGLLFVKLGPWNGGPMWSPAGMVAGGLGVLLSLTGLVPALRLVFVGGPPPGSHKLDPDTFLAQLAKAPRPAFGCLDCRLVLPCPPCPECGARSTCIEVASEDDLRLARAAVKPTAVL